MLRAFPLLLTACGLTGCFIEPRPVSELLDSGSPPRVRGFDTGLEDGLAAAELTDVLAADVGATDLGSDDRAATGVVSLAGSACLKRPAKQITVVPAGTHTNAYLVKGGTHQTHDLRGTFFKANPPKFPVSFNAPVDDVCVVGASVQGTQPRSWTWDQMKHGDNQKYDGDGIGWSHPVGPMIIEGAWIDNVEDALGPPKSPETSRSASWIVRHVYARYIRDDFMENDACLNGEMYDTLVDGTHMFLSVRPGKNNTVKTGTTPVIKIRDTMVRLDCKPDDRSDTSCGPGASLGQLFKWTTACNPPPVVDIADTIFRVDDISRNGAGPMAFPPGTYKNVTLIYLGQGSYPGKLPASGVTETKDVALWDAARARWLQRHGCDAKGESCTFLKP